MKRYYYLSDDLNDLEHVEEELENAGVAKPQIHVLSNKDAEVAGHHRLHIVDSVMKKDVIHSSELGALVGVLAAAFLLLLAYFFNWTETLTWAPFILFALIIFGFCTWEGGLFGLRKNNVQFRRFEQALKAGKHIFFVDVDEQQRKILEGVIDGHPRMSPLGVGRAVPRVFVWGQRKWQAFLESAP